MESNISVVESALPSTKFKVNELPQTLHSVSEEYQINHIRTNQRTLSVYGFTRVFPRANLCRIWTIKYVYGLWRILSL